MPTKFVNPMSLEKDDIIIKMKPSYAGQSFYKVKEKPVIKGDLVIVDVLRMRNAEQEDVISDQVKYLYKLENAEIIAQ